MRWPITSHSACEIRDRIDVSRSTPRGKRNVHKVHQTPVGAHVITTDVWASMGQEDEARVRQDAFANYCVDEDVMAKARDNAIFLHCLPAHRGEEVTASVIDGPRSRIFDEAENRLHIQKAILDWCLGRCELPSF